MSTREHRQQSSTIFFGKGLYDANKTHELSLSLSIPLTYYELFQCRLRCPSNQCVCLSAVVPKVCSERFCHLQDLLQNGKHFTHQTFNPCKETQSCNVTLWNSIGQLLFGWRLTTSGKTRETVPSIFYPLLLFRWRYNLRKNSWPFAP